MTLTNDKKTFKSAVFIASCLSSTVLLLALAFQWSLMDKLTPFLALPVIGLAWLFWFVVTIWAAVHAFKQRKIGRAAYIPILVCTITFLFAIFFPFTKIWINANFYLNKTERESVVSQVLSKKLIPNVSHNSSLIKLTNDNNISSGGNEIIVREYNKHTYVFFFTYRGILDNYSGFLWVPKGGKPKLFQDAGENGTQILSYGDSWYFIGSH